MACHVAKGLAFNILKMFFAIGAFPSGPIFDFRIEPRKGLIVESAGVPLIEGSSVQFYKPDWSKGYYSSAYGPQSVTQIDADTVRLAFDSPDHLASGAVTYHRSGDQLAIHYDLGWDGEGPANVEIGAGLIWAPAVERGNLTSDGKPTRSLDHYAYSGQGIEDRRFSIDSSSYQFSAPIGVVSEKSSAPLTLFDGRGYAQDWAKGHEYFWLGSLGIPLAKGKRFTLDLSYQIDVTSRKMGSPITLALKAIPDAETLLPDSAHPPLIPKPQMAKLDWSHPLVDEGNFSFPIGSFDHLDDFKAALARRFEVSSIVKGAKSIAFDGGISKLGMVPGGYRLTITPGSISVLGEEDEGLVNGLNRLASIAFVSNGKICFPTGTIVDQPQTDWRGVHLFVGPEALQFQSKLWKDVLRPLGFNKAVLQCERTAWSTLPSIATPKSMTKTDLSTLFRMYRHLGVDPIPLVQSYGHMEWFFANAQNRDLSLSPNAPYAIDPENPKAADTLTALWSEIIQSLHPDVVHFGCDEVNMLGPKQDPQTKTKLWGKQMGLLESIAKKNKVGMMIWGDEAIAPGEAPDATNGDDPTNAAERRQAIPRGTFIGDWHYTGQAKSTDFRNDLQTWKDAGLKPIASTWYNPNNIAAFDAEAGALGCGTLQTTWCGYESSEEGMLANFNQFSAMVLAADYSWSARKETPSELDYDPAQVFRKMYYGRPSPLTPRAGASLCLNGASDFPFNVGQVKFSHPVSVSLASALVNAETGIGGASFTSDAKGTRLELACNTPIRAVDDGEMVAEVYVKLIDGKTIVKKLAYGLDVRAAEDRAPLPLADRNKDGTCAIEMILGPQPVQIESITIRELNRYTGFTVKGIAVIN